LPAGGLIHLKGANGAGKTTLLKLIAGLLQPSHGHIQYAGQLINSNLDAYHSHLCFVGHKTGINPYLSLRENCFFDTHYNGLKNDINELASIFNLEKNIDTPCGLLSAGQRRQVGLLRLWMSDAKLWLLDEPFVALDDDALSIIMAKIDSHREQGGSVLLTSHQTLPLSRSDYQEFQL
jgi:heme exporter protein A